MIHLVDIGVKTEYAVRALALLSRHGPEAIITVKELAEEAGISVHFLYTIFDLLERYGLVRAHKGRRRGFSLARPADQISFLDILHAVEGPIEKYRCLLDRRDQCHPDRPCAAHHAWQHVRDQVEKELSGVMLAQIAWQNPPWQRLKELAFLD